MTNCKDGARNDINMGKVITEETFVEKEIKDSARQRKRTQIKQKPLFVLHMAVIR